jgi:hypothetical protein
VLREPIAWGPHPVPAVGRPFSCSRRPESTVTLPPEASTSPVHQPTAAPSLGEGLVLPGFSEDFESEARAFHYRRRCPALPDGRVLDLHTLRSTAVRGPPIRNNLTRVFIAQALQKRVESCQSQGSDHPRPRTVRPAAWTNSGSTTTAPPRSDSLPRNPPRKSALLSRNRARPASHLPATPQRVHAGGTSGLGPTFQIKLSTSTLPSMR